MSIFSQMKVSHDSEQKGIAYEQEKGNWEKMVSKNRMGYLLYFLFLASRTFFNIQVYELEKNAWYLFGYFYTFGDTWWNSWKIR